MKRFISLLTISSFCVGFIFGAVKVPKGERMQYRFEPAQSEHVQLSHGSTPIVY